MPAVIMRTSTADKVRQRLMPLADIHEGFDVPEYGTWVPWLITRSELFRYIPEKLCTVSAGGWPKCQFTLFGVTANFAFNFVIHPERRLLGLQFNEPDSETIEDSFRATSARLREHLGEPNAVNHPGFPHSLWRDDRVWVNHKAGVPDPPAVRSHTLEIHYHAGRPRAWVGPGERTLAEVKRLLNLLPGVEVVEIGCRPEHTGIGITIGFLPSLARVAFTTQNANILLQVCIHDYRVANGELNEHDPAAVLYRMDIPGRRDPEPGGYSTRLQILGIGLTNDLRELGLLGDDEAERLLARFNNHEHEA